MEKLPRGWGSSGREMSLKCSCSWLPPCCHLVAELRAGVRESGVPWQGEGLAQ